MRKSYFSSLPPAAALLRWGGKEKTMKRYFYMKVESSAAVMVIRFLTKADRDRLVVDYEPQAFKISGTDPLVAMAKRQVKATCGDWPVVIKK